MNYYPTGAGIPERSIPEYPDGWGEEEGHWLTRSGILTSQDLIHWEYLCDTTPLDINDRDNILFPEKINGSMYASQTGRICREEYGTEKRPCGSATPKTWFIGTSPSRWQRPRTTIGSLKIGGSTPPVRTDKGWLVLYHGVDQDTVYRVGALLLDLENPEIIIARTRRFIMEPETYYEKFGYQIPNVVFPTGNVVRTAPLYLLWRDGYGDCARYGSSG